VLIQNERIRSVGHRIGGLAEIGLEVIVLTAEKAKEAIDASIQRCESRCVSLTQYTWWSDRLS
jgi:hypothetical protein